jgi:hypothetical protein
MTAHGVESALRPALLAIYVTRCMEPMAPMAAKLIGAPMAIQAGG